MEQLGKYGFLRRDYLKNHRNSTYQVMIMQDEDYYVLTIKYTDLWRCFFHKSVYLSYGI